MHRFACVVLVDPRGRLLLQERDEHPVLDPETWSLCGGHVEDGEDPEAAAYRELAEETGVELAPGTLRAYAEFQVFHEAYGTHDQMSVYVAPTRLDDDGVQCHEGRQIVFVEPAVARGLTLSTAATRVVPDLLDSPTYAALVAELAEQTEQTEPAETTGATA